MMKVKRGDKGFTLIELMIVVAIIGILAAVAMPKFADLVRKSKEGATKGNLGTLRSALSVYYADNEGLWPATLAGMVAVMDATGNSAKYLDAVPQAKVGCYGAPDSSAEEAGDQSDVDGATGGWVYDNATGVVLVNCTGTDTKGNLYTSW